MKFAEICVGILPFLQVCCSISTSYRQNEGRLAGGQLAGQGQFPFSAGVWALFPTFPVFCSGAYIGGRWLLTTEQCVQFGSSFHIRLGSLRSEPPDEGSVLAIASFKVIHPEGLALLQMDSDIELGANIRPIGLVAADGDAVGTEATLIGWGATSDLEEPPTEWLNFGSQTVTDVGDDECTSTAILCAQGEVSPCGGDQGAPLIALNSTSGEYQLLGLARRGPLDRCLPALLSKFYRVSTYIDWIAEVQSNYTMTDQ